MGSLTLRRIAAIKGPGRYGDGRNLFLAVSPTGSKSWAFLYTLNRRHRQMGLGSIDLMGLEDARDRALELRRLVKQGVDPIDARAASMAKPAPRITTFQEVAEDCIASLVPGWTNSKSEGQWRQSLSTYAYPTLGGMDVASISTDDIYAVLEPIWATKAETAGRLRARIEKVLDRATARKLRSGVYPARLKGTLDPLLAMQRRPLSSRPCASAKASPPARSSSRSSPPRARARRWGRRGARSI